MLFILALVAILVVLLVMNKKSNDYKEYQESESAKHSTQHNLDVFKNQNEITPPRIDPPNTEPSSAPCLNTDSETRNEITLLGVNGDLWTLSGKTLTIHHKNKVTKVPTHSIQNIEIKLPSRLSNGMLKIKTGQPSSYVRMSPGVSVGVGGEMFLVFLPQETDAAQKMVDDLSE